MRTIRALLLASAAALLIAGIAVAAGRAGSTGGQCPLYHGEKLASYLGLTDSQHTQIRDIVAKYRPQFKALRSTNRDRDEWTTGARDIREKMQKEVDAVLTPAQREKLANWRSQHEEWTCGKQQGASKAWDGRREWTRDRHVRQSDARHAIDRVARELSLTHSQRKKVDGIYAQHRDEIRSLIRDAQAPKADRGQIRQRAEALKETLVGEVRPILKPEQQQKLQAMIERWEKQHQG